MTLPKSLHLAFAFFIFSFQLAAQNFQEKVEHFIVLEQVDSAQKYIPRVDNPSYRQTLHRIANNHASYKDYATFLDKSLFFGKTQYGHLNEFLSKHIHYPTDRKNVDLEFVKLKASQIEMIANELVLKNANKESNRLKEYLASIQNKKTSSYKIAQLYGQLHAGLLDIIQISPEGKKIAKRNAHAAMKLGDVYLSLKYEDLALNYLIAEGDLFGYIDACEKSLQVERELPKKTPLYETTIAHLVDALIFRNNGFDPHVEELLMELYYSPNYHYQSFSLMAKYIAHLPTNDSNALKFYKLVGTSNVGDFSRKLIALAKNKINDNELTFLYHECTVACYYQKDYANCFALNNDKTFLIKQVYSSELSQTIADYQTQEVAREKEFKIQQEKEKTRFYLIIAAVIAFFLLISIYLIIITVRKSKILAIRNHEKEMLVKEINHRVKNNFQLVNSLLELQSKEIGDEETIKKLNEGQSRIKAMSLIHQKLYQTEYLGLVNFQEYTDQLAVLMLEMVGMKNVQTQIIAKDILLDIDTAIPLGLILNELFTNSIKYALTDAQTDFVHIEISVLNDNQFQLSYRDPGAGMDFSQPAKGTGMGMRLIRSLVRQIQGEIRLNSEDKANFVFTFKDKKGRKNVD